MKKYGLRKHGLDGYKYFFIVDTLLQHPLGHQLSTTSGRIMNNSPRNVRVIILYHGSRYTCCFPAILTQIPNKKELVRKPLKRLL